MKKMAGFTLVETVILMLIISILAVISFPALNQAMQHLRLRSASERLISDLRYARELALSRHGTYGIEFNTTNNTYEVFSWDGIAKTTVSDPTTGNPLLVDFDTLPGTNGVSITSANTCQGVCSSEQIRIDSFGKPSDSAGTALQSAATIMLQNGIFSATVQVTPQTGYSRIS